MSESSYRKNDQPIIGISIGDFNGIGPEVIMKALSDNRIYKFFTPVIYADGRIISFYRKHLNLDFNYNLINTLDKVQPRKVNVLNVNAEKPEVTPGEPSEAGGKYALESLQRVVHDVKEGELNAIVTGPVSKELIQSEEFKFPGHTEYLTKESEVSDSLMLLAGDELRIGVVTGHIPVKDIAAAITPEKVKTKLKILLNSLKRDFGIKKPRVAVLGLNPHAGENGLLGDEEIKVIIPCIKEQKDQGNLVFGPYPADGFFGSTQYTGFDGILAMYHDQGLIPFKQVAFSSGVNYTAGLSFIRTSPDHGTAFSLAGKGVADESSLRNALLLAVDIVNRRLDRKSL